MRRGAPESQFRAVTGIPLPPGILNLHTKLWFGPVGGGGVVYFEGPPSVLKQFIERHQLEAEPFDKKARPHVPAEIPKPGPLAWQSHRSPDGMRPGGSHLQVFSSTNSPGVYVFTFYRLRQGPSRTQSLRLAVYAGNHEFRPRAGNVRG
jgi:hypothetical protein